MKNGTVFIELHDNGAVLLNQIAKGQQEILIGRKAYLERMAELYDEQCLSIQDVADKTVER